MRAGRLRAKRPLRGAYDPRRTLAALKPARSLAGLRDALCYGPVCPTIPKQARWPDKYGFLFEFDPGHDR
jgi:hypothetical protein